VDASSRDFKIGDQARIILPSVWPEWMEDPLRQEWKQALQRHHHQIVTIEDICSSARWPGMDHESKFLVIMEEDDYVICQDWLSPLTNCNCPLRTVLGSGCHNPGHI